MARDTCADRPDGTPWEGHTVQRIELTIDVTEAASLGEKAFVAVTAHLPDPERLGAPPVVCFAKPGAGFTRV